MAPDHGYRPAIRQAALGALLTLAANLLAEHSAEAFTAQDREELIHDLAGCGDLGSALDDAMPRVYSALTRGEYRQWLLAPSAHLAACRHDYASAATARARGNR